MKKLIKILIIFMIFINIFQIKVKAENEDEMMKNTQNDFNISSFLKETKKYTGEFLEDEDLTEIFNQSVKGSVDNTKLYKKILNILGKEVTASIKILISILAIVVIHGLLKTISENLKSSNIAEITYFVQYILIVTLIMSNFTEIINLVKQTAQNLVGFINLLLPLLLTLMMYTGNITTTSILQPILLFIINFIGNIIVDILIPIVLIIVVINIISKISNKVQISKISKFLKSGVTWFLGVSLTIFVGIVSLEGTLGSSIDGMTTKTTKAIVANAIPVVGKILSDITDSVLGCGLILKNAVGFVGVIVVISICVMPIIKIGTLSIIYNLASGLVQPIADEKIVKLLEEMGTIFKLLLGILCALSVMLIIGITLVIKISNSGMMYR